MTVGEARALATLTSFLLGPPERLIFYAVDVDLVQQKEALAALEYLQSRCTSAGGVVLHTPQELAEKWTARFGQVEGEEVGNE